MLYLIYLILFVLGLSFLFFPRNIKSNKLKIKLDSMIKQDCSTKKVKCIDSCNFLCTDNNYECINNICQLKANINIKCSKETGGIIVLTHFNFIPYWKCLCTKPDLFGGPECSEKRMDVCKNGTFRYEGHGLDKISCICNKPYILMHWNNKPYCVESQYSNFFPEIITF